jgi:hypothetical protein
MREDAHREGATNDPVSRTDDDTVRELDAQA